MKKLETSEISEKCRQFLKMLITEFPLDLAISLSGT
jgi:hypothetical protein